MSAIDNLTKREFVSLMLGLPATTFLTQFAGAQSADTLNIAFMADVQSWDPTAVTFPVGQSIYKCVFDSPLHYSSDQKLQPRQIVSRKWLDDNNTRLEITLRDDIFFHDGSKLTTEDVKYSWLDRPQKDKKLAIARPDAGPEGRRDHLPDHRRCWFIPSRRRRRNSISPSSPSISCRRPITRRSATKASWRSRSAPGPTSSSTISAARASCSKPSTSIGAVCRRSRT